MRRGFAPLPLHSGCLADGMEAAKGVSAVFSCSLPIVALARGSLFSLQLVGVTKGPPCCVDGWSDRSLYTRGIERSSLYGIAVLLMEREVAVRSYFFTAVFIFLDPRLRVSAQASGVGVNDNVMTAW